MRSWLLSQPQDAPLHLLEAPGQDQSKLLIHIQNVFGVVNEVEMSSACQGEDFLWFSQVQRTKGSKKGFFSINFTIHLMSTSTLLPPSHGQALSSALY